MPAGLGLTCEAGWGLAQYLNQVSLILLELPRDQNAAQLAHPDLRWVVSDGAAIKVDQIRQLVDFAVATPSLAKRKVAAVLDAHLMNQAAANALLKTLEEPPPNTHILLATHKWGALLPTIRSRLQQFYVSPDVSEAQNWLMQQGISVDALGLAEFARAPLRIAQAQQAGEPKLLDWLSQSLRTELATAVDALSEVDVVDALARWYRLLLCHVSEPCIEPLSAPNAAVLKFAQELLDIRYQAGNIQCRQHKNCCWNIWC